MHYAAAASHPWGLSPKEPFNGFALRAQLREQFTSHLASNATTPILFDDILDPIDGAQNLTEFQEHMTQAVFCPQPAGDSPTRRGMYDAILLGCIPVIFRAHSLDRLFPSAPEFNPTLFTVLLNEQEIINGASLIDLLLAIPAEEILRKQIHIQSLAGKTQWALPTKKLWFPSAPGAKPLGNVPRWNTSSAHDKRGGGGLFSNDAFGQVIRELGVIKSGKWVSRSSGQAGPSAELVVDQLDK